MAGGTHIAALEARVKEIIKQSADLKRRAAMLETRLIESKAGLLDARARLVRQAAEARRWERERDWLRRRLKHILGELELIESDGDKDTGGTR